MVLYRLVCITNHFPEYAQIKHLVTTSAQLVMNQGGVVRGFNCWGTKALPQRMRRHRQWHQVGDYWSMQFDASPRTMNSLVDRLRGDPRVIRWTTLKVAETAKDMARVKAKEQARDIPYFT